MRVGSLSRQLFRLSGPIFIETLLMMLLGATDTFMLSQHGDNSVAAVGLVNQILNLIFLVFQVISVATSILCSQYFGAGKRDKMVQTVVVSLLLNLTLGLGISLLLFGFGDRLLHLMGMRPDIFADGLSYIRIVGAVAVFQAISFTCSAVFRSVNKAQLPMYVSVVVNVLNVAGNYTLIFGHFGMPALGVTGAAISTAVSRGTAMLIMLVMLRKTIVPHIPMELFRPFPWEEAGKLLKIGIPSAGEHVSYDLSQVVITYLINLLGNEALATRSYCVNIVMFTYLISLALAEGGAVLVGQLVGMQKPRAAYLIGKRVLSLGVGSSVLFSLLTALAGSRIMPLLTDNETIIRVGMLVLWVDVLVENGRAINLFAVMSLRAAGDIYFPVILSIIVCWSMSVGGSWLMGIVMGGGLAAMWLAFALDENIRGWVFIHRWNSMRWVGKSFTASHDM